MRTRKHIIKRVIDGETQIGASHIIELTKQSELVLDPLKSDFRYALKHFRQDPASQFWARTAIRCLCAMIEAILFTLRRWIQLIAEASRVKPNGYEIAFLAEEEKPRPNFRYSVRELIRLYGKVTGVPVVIDENEKGFQALWRTYQRRNNLMHPNNELDLQVSQQDMDTARVGFEWLSATLIGIGDAVAAKAAASKQHFPKSGS